jgi:hypothetical protein
MCEYALYQTPSTASNSPPPFSSWHFLSRFPPFHCRQSSHVAAAKARANRLDPDARPAQRFLSASQKAAPPVNKALRILFGTVPPLIWSVAPLFAQAQSQSSQPSPSSQQPQAQSQAQQKEDSVAEAARKAKGKKAVPAQGKAVLYAVPPGASLDSNFCARKKSGPKTGPRTSSFWRSKRIKLEAIAV